MTDDQNVEADGQAVIRGAGHQDGASPSPASGSQPADARTVNNCKVLIQKGKVWLEEIEGGWGEERFLEGFTPAEARLMAAAFSEAADAAEGKD